MIPLRLRMRNFLSYGMSTQTINFAPYHLICLSGKNGHGKSALLDALTWAVWGQARKVQGTAKCDESLLRIGQTHMMVTLDFICNNQEYRVCREFVLQQKKSSTELSFGYIQNQQFVSLTEKSIRATQQKIVEIIGLEYEAFINSVFLRQGQSNEFSQKSAKERKDILASILGIDHFETLRAQALEKARLAQADYKTREQQHEYLLQEIQHLEPVQEQYQETLQNLEQSALQESALSLMFAEAQQTKSALLKHEHDAQLIRFQLGQEEQNISKKSAHMATIVHEWRTVRRQHTSLNHATYQQEKKTREDAVRAYEQLRDDYLHHKEKLLRAQEMVGRLKQTFMEEYTHITHKLQLQVQTLELQSAALKKNCEEFQNKLTLIINAGNEQDLLLKKYETQKLHLSMPLEQINAYERLFERKKNFYHRFSTYGNQLQRELEQYQTEIEHRSDRCPVCEQAITAECLHRVQQRIVVRKRRRMHTLNRLKKIVPMLKQVLVDEHACLERYKKNALDARMLIEKIAHHTTLKNDYTAQKEVYNQQLTDEAHKLAIAEQQHLSARQLYAEHQALKDTYQERNPVYQKLMQEYEHFTAAIQQHRYNISEHEKVLQAYKNYAELDAQAHTLLQQMALQGQRKQTVAILCKELKLHKGALQMLQKQQEFFTKHGQQLLEIEKIIMRYEQEQRAMSAQRMMYMQHKGAYEQQVGLLAKRKQELETCVANLQQSRAVVEDYQEIATALGKNGIQALLIENALPEIEFEANQLLSKLTDNQSQISIESLRDLKSGTTRETLDIKISDAMGIRPYELFSGGEAFRIDFALRIAISKLLTRRAGASLQILIIDEGFGSQDEEGLSHIMEALYKIQDEFAKIIIVSHLPSMKDQFPTHFVVSKEATGSVVSVLEQG